MCDIYWVTTRLCWFFFSDYIKNVISYSVFCYFSNVIVKTIITSLLLFSDTLISYCKLRVNTWNATKFDRAMADDEVVEEAQREPVVPTLNTDPR